MRDTTLNTIAIVIFAITMASLLGPLVNLSPALLAIIAAAGLGLFTVDQFNLQGRIGNILMDSLAWMSADHRQRVLHHEAGHFLAAVLLEIPVEGYSLTTWEAWKQGLPGQGGVIFGRQDLTSETTAAQLTPQWVDRYCQVWMAGMAAEQLLYGNAIGGEDDMRALGILWNALGRPASEGLIKQRWAALQAKALLEKHRDAFDALVTAMGDRAPVATCCEVIQQHRPTVEVG
ncbi:MAG: ATP-dependent Zn protease [Leptolyngbyaceae cyanobacterium SM2_3_12]|nr:ATP-dependent Zn protease [Leptolyngbyaceae cyanobacterium SM2_3_12]